MNRKGTCEFFLIFVKTVDIKDIRQNVEIPVIANQLLSIQTAFLILQCMHSEIDTVISYLLCIGSYLKCQEGKPVRRKGPTVPEQRE